VSERERETFIDNQQVTERERERQRERERERERERDFLMNGTQSAKRLGMEDGEEEQQAGWYMGERK
jgi:hypothetical protein